MISLRALFVAKFLFQCVQLPCSHRSFRRRWQRQEPILKVPSVLKRRSARFRLYRRRRNDVVDDDDDYADDDNVPTFGSARVDTNLSRKLQS